jgi:hypothetical protein
MITIIIMMTRRPKKSGYDARRYRLLSLSWISLFPVSFLTSAMTSATQTKGKVELWG